MAYYLILVLFNILLVCQAADPIPPTTWPPVWHTWVVVNVVDASKETSVYVKGQRIAFDTENNYVCRYQQEMLYPATDIQKVDMCDFQATHHWGIDTEKGNINCTFNATLNYTVQPLVWPQAFLANAKFIGIDKLADNICNHWVAISVPIDGKTQQMDVWATVDNGYPCQIVLWEMDTTMHTTWAFDGFTDFIPPEAESCSAAQVMCTHPDYVCNAIRGLDPDQLGAQLAWVCDPARLNCTPINPYGLHFQPNTLEDHCDWAFNTYYIANRANQGSYACNFNGVAELVPPSNSSSKVFSQPSKRSDVNKFRSDHNYQEIQSYLTSVDLVCPDK